MKPLVTITLCVMFLLPSYVSAQEKAAPNQPNIPTLKEQVIIKEGTTPIPSTADMAPESVITTRSRPVPGPVMHTAALPKSTLDEQIVKYERHLNGLTPEYRQANPEIVKNLELILKKKKTEKALIEKAATPAPSN